MSKKRKRRYTMEELVIHEEAVRIRKMTDKQLVEEFHRAADADIDVRPSNVMQDRYADDNDNTSVQKLISALSEGKCKGIKSGLAYKIAEFAEEMGLI